MLHWFIFEIADLFIAYAAIDPFPPTKHSLVGIKISEIKVISFGIEHVNTIKILCHCTEFLALCIKDINRGNSIHFLVKMADKTDKRAFIALMVLAVITGIITFYAFGAATPKAGTVDSIYRQDLPPQATATEESAAGGGGAVDESAYANKVEIKILKGSSTQGNPSYDPNPGSTSSDALVTWVNDDTVPHTATSGAGPQDPESGKLFDTGIIMAGDKASVPAEKIGAGKHDYHCTVHPFMQGKITIT